MLKNQKDLKCFKMQITRINIKMKNIANNKNKKVLIQI